MAKNQKNDRICPICGRKFRVNLKNGNTRKYCSKKCSVKANKNKANRRNNFGTSSTLSLSPKSVKYQLFLIRNNIDKGGRQFSSDKSKRDVILELTVYDEERGIIREVYDND